MAPDHLTLIEDTHTNKKTKEIQDQVAKQVIEVCRKRKDEYILSQPPLDDDGQPPKVPLELMNQIVLEVIMYLIYIITLFLYFQNIYS